MTRPRLCLNRSQNPTCSKYEDRDNESHLQVCLTMIFKFTLKVTWYIKYVSYFEIVNIGNVLINNNIKSVSYKRHNNHIAITQNDFFQLSGNTNTRGHPFKLTIPLTHTNLRKYFFSSRIIPIWNSLPANIVNASTPSLFKKLVSGHDLSLFLHYCDWSHRFNLFSVFLFKFVFD